PLRLFPSAPSHFHSAFFLPLRPPPRSTLFPYTTLFRSALRARPARAPSRASCRRSAGRRRDRTSRRRPTRTPRRRSPPRPHPTRSEEHTSELQSLTNLVCRLLLEKKKNTTSTQCPHQSR